MGKYLIKYSKRAINDLKDIKKSGRKLDMKKIQTLILELEEILEPDSDHLNS
ncbi:hypothetical protein [Chryseobacterium foetidum]|uniref:hypothetical protein n=1 Tax=Chryseobacterium foetidum TaxID=2951057 RepID=UPI0021C68983|nr:hypothetical protein [Chryseobacterium foetidum]